MNKGDIVKIYQMPISREDYEGEAKLISIYREDHGDGLTMWEVEFLDEPGNTYCRTIYQEPK